MNERLLDKLFFSSFILTVLIIAFSNNSFDYKQYEVQWQYFLESGNPWRWGSNTYGPLHGMFAYVHSIWVKAPRMIFSLTFLFASYLLAKELLKDSKLELSQKKLFIFLLLLNPLYWIFSVVFGCNDAFVAGLTLFSILLYRNNKYLTSALFLSLAILMKFIPIIIIPFLAFYQNRIRWRFSIASISITLIGFYISYLKWGGMVFHPFRVSAEREAKLLSIFRYIDGDFSILPALSNHQTDLISTQIIAYGLILIFFMYLLTNSRNQLTAIALALTFLLTFYKVGHFQFYMSLELILFLLIADLGKEGFHYQAAIKVLFFFIIWFGLLTISFAATEGYYKNFEFLREIISLPQFTVSLILILALYNQLFQGYRIEIKITNSLY